MTTRRSLKEKISEFILDKTEAGGSVFISRAIPTDIHDLPVILIYMKNEDVELFDESPRRYKRTASVVIECISSGVDDSDADDKVEKIAAQVEDLLTKDETLDCLADDTWLGNINFQSEADGQSPVAAAVLTFNVQYFREPISEQCLPDYLRSGVEWQVGHHDESSDETIDAEDEFEIPQE